MGNWEDCPSVEWIPDWLGGVWVFKGTRLPIRFLFEFLSTGGTVRGFAKWYGIDDSGVVAVLTHEARQLQLRCPSVSDAAADQSPSGDNRKESSRTDESYESDGWRGKMRTVLRAATVLVILSAVLLAAFAFLAVALEPQDNTIHAALTAMCAAAILVVQPFGGVWTRRTAPPVAGLVALASGLLWLAKDTSVPEKIDPDVIIEPAVSISPIEPALLGTLGLLAAICLFMAVMIAGTTWYVTRQ